MSRQQSATDLVFDFNEVPAPMDKPAESSPAPSRRRRRRWLVRIPVIGIVTLATVVVLTQIFLWTDYPRRIAEAQVERILHVRTTIKSVSIGWLGHTRIEGVSLTLPTEKEPFLSIATIDASHASLPLIAFDQNLSSVVVSGVDLALRQDAAGRWNVQQLVPPSSAAATNPTSTRRTNPLADLPSLHAEGVHVTLARSDGKQLAMPVVKAELQKHDQLNATFDADAGDALHVEGELGQNASLTQSLRATFTGIPADVAAFFDVAAPSPLSASIEWEGRLTGTGIAGSLKLMDVRAALARATGTVDLETDNAGRLVVRPTDFKVVIADGAQFDLRANAGRIALDRAVSIEGLAGTLNGGHFAVDGTIDPTTFVSDLAMHWEQVTRDTLATTGSAHVQTSRLFNGKIKLDADLRGGARIQAGEATGAIRISGEGSQLDAVVGSIQLDPLTWTPADGSQPIVTPRLNGEIATAGTHVTLSAQRGEDASVQGTLTAFGDFDRQTQTWWATFDAGALGFPAIAARGIKDSVDVSLAASGSLTHVDISKAYAKLDKFKAYAAGSYDLRAPGLLKASLWTWHEKPESEDQAAQFNSISALTNISGTLFPRNLAADVDLKGNDLIFEQQAIGDVSLHLTAAIGEDEASIRTQELEAFGGHWSLHGHWSRTEGGPPLLVAHFHDVPAANLGQMIGRSDLKGTVGGEAKIHVRSSRLDQLEMTATASGTDLFAGPFRAESLDLAATLHGGKFDLKPTLHENGGTITADAKGDVMFAAPMTAAVTLDNWPAPYVESTAAGAQRFRPRASGTANAQVSLRTGDVSGDVALKGTVERDESKLADFAVKGSLDHKMVTISQFSLDTLDGTFGATGKINLGDYNASVVNATFDNLTPARLDWSNPIFGEVPGKLSGTFSIRPSTAQRPLAPLEVELNVQPAGTSFRGVRIGDISLLAFCDFKTPNQFRVVTDRAVLNIAGGRIEPFVRLSSEPVRGVAQLITANFSGLDLNELAKAANSGGKDVVGKIGGTISLYGQTTNLKTLTGAATIDISDSDLANFGPISALYYALSVGSAGTKPIGSGSISLRIDSDTLTIDDANYFNRGVYANAFGPIRGISNGIDAKVDHALVVGSLQPLRAVKLPFFGDVNDTLAALQSSVTAIDVTGTAKNPKMQQVSLSAIGSTFQKLLLGKTREK